MLTDATGIVLVVMLSAANVHDSEMLSSMLDQFHTNAEHHELSHSSFQKLHADKAYDSADCRHTVHHHGMDPRIARRGIESTEKLGRHRWAVERTMAWFDGYRKLRIRDERKSDHFLALHKVAAISMLWNRLVQVV